MKSGVPKSLGLCGAGIALALCGGYAVIQRAQPAVPLRNPVYVWQTHWTAPVVQAVQRTAATADAFWVFAGEVDGRDGKWRMQGTVVDWPALAASGREATVVLRANSALASHLASRESFDTTRDFVADVVRRLLAETRRSGVPIAGVQIDCDCPTAKLADYRRLLCALRESLPNVALSITALPAWLDSAEFARLVRGLDYYVLQVHSLEKPSRADEPLVLCDYSKIPVYLAKASKIRAPFYVALPTYAYRVFYDAAGGFVGLAAEDSSPQAPPGLQMREVQADPEALAPVVRMLHEKPPRRCQGIAWFRMPVDTDLLNWSWPTFQAVMAGKPPRSAFTAEVRYPRQDLCEIWVANVGDHRPSAPIRLEVHWNGARVRACDLIGGFAGDYRPDAAAMTLTGPAPDREAPVMAAWYLLGTETRGAVPAIRTGKVEVVQ